MQIGTVKTYLHKSKNEILPVIFFTAHQILNKFRGDFYKNVLRECVYFKDIGALKAILCLAASIIFYAYFPDLLPDVGKNRYKRCTHNAVDKL